MILIDSNEPQTIIDLIQQSVPATVTDLNRIHISDYFFGNPQGKRFQFSRKQAVELLGNIDEAEDQLRDYYNQADENFQIVEGIISPVKLRGTTTVGHFIDPLTIRHFTGNLYAYKVDPNGYMHEGHSFQITESMLQAWIHRLDAAGITTYFAQSWASTAKLLVTIYKNEQKPPEEHSTLQRIIKPRIAIREPDNFTKALVLFCHSYRVGVGEKKVKSITARYNSFLDLVMSEVHELCECQGIGKGIAEKLMRALGREV